MPDVRCALTIAGTDPSGGAGIQADLKTFQEFKTYGMSVITSVVAQNTTGVQAVHHIPLHMIEQQLDSVFSDMPVHAFKTGMIANADMMGVIKRNIEQRCNMPYVIDPVMVATSGDTLIDQEARTFLRDELLPLAALITPNIPEAEALLDQDIKTEQDMEHAAIRLVKDFGAGAALIKGGHLKGDALDILYDGTFHYFSAPRIDTKNTHGTGCTLSAAITACLAQGMPLKQAVTSAKTYITAAIRHSFPIGSGNGPTNHWAAREKEVSL